MKIKAALAIACGLLASCEKMTNSDSTELGSIISSHAVRPTCENIGTKGEGWYINGDIVSWERCENRAIACLYKGTRSEGWYAFDAGDARLVRWGMCSETTTDPACVNVGSRSEGWSGTSLDGTSWLRWDNCQNRQIACLRAGTRSEGWYSVQKSGAQLVRYEQCGE